MGENTGLNQGVGKKGVVRSAFYPKDRNWEKRKTHHETLKKKGGRKKERDRQRGLPGSGMAGRGVIDGRYTWDHQGFGRRGHRPYQHQPHERNSKRQPPKTSEKGGKTKPR